MFGVGPQELLIIALLALVLFGPRKFLDMSREVGRFVNETRTYTDELKSELVSEEVREARREVQKVRSEIVSAENRDGPAGDARPGERDEMRGQRKPPREDVDRPKEVHTRTKLVSEEVYEVRGGGAEKPASKLDSSGENEPRPDGRDEVGERPELRREDVDHPEQEVHARSERQRQVEDSGAFNFGGVMVDTTSRARRLKLRLFGGKR